MAMTINLTSNGFTTTPVDVADQHSKASLEINADADKGGFGGAVVELEWSIGPFDSETDELWHSFSPAITLNNTTPFIRKKSISGVRKLRYKVTGADGNADSNAKSIILVR